jgi:hypothetical protein
MLLRWRRRGLEADSKSKKKKKSTKAGSERDVLDDEIDAELDKL